MCAYAATLITSVKVARIVAMASALAESVVPRPE